ncbi:MAG: thiopurine S-methyltransferase [Phenylobacterium sp.]|jgi:thiopurine S-methyltransferase
MKADFWHQCWENDHIAFHQDDYHPLMMQLWCSWAGDTQGAVFVPLCGKSSDMNWIAKHHKVIGSELSDIACRDFYVDNNISYQLNPLSLLSPDAEGLTHYQSEHIDLYQGDFFALSPQDVDNCSLIYDRAALIALPPALRAQYAAHLQLLFAQGGKLLLFTVEYPKDEIKGPPFCVSEEEVNTLFAGCEITRVVAQPMADNQFARRTLKVSWLLEVAYFIDL